MKGKNGYSKDGIEGIVPDGETISDKIDVPQPGYRQIITVPGTITQNPYTGEFTVSKDAKYRFDGWKVIKGTNPLAPNNLPSVNDYGQVHEYVELEAQWTRLYPVTYKVLPSKFAPVANGSPLYGVYNENGILMTGTLSDGDIFYVYEDEPFSIFSSVGNGIYVGLYIKTIKYGDETSVLMAAYEDVRTGGSSTSYTVTIAQTKAAFTGDDFNPGLWLTLAFVSLAGAAWTLKKRTRKRAK